MVRTSLRAVATGTVATMAIGGVVLTGAVGAQAGDAGRQITGTWQVTVQPEGPPGAASFESTIVYTATGSAIEATQKAPSSAGLGSWERLGEGRYALTISKYRFNGSEFVGKTVIEETQQVAPDGATYTGQAVTTVYNAGGGVLAQFASTATGSRL